MASYTWRSLSPWGLSQKHALSSHLKNLLRHLLKWHYQPSRRHTGHSWRSIQ
ncbi:MAG: DUF29 family protein [Candidatus Tectimicrobiota bacterium]